MTSLEQHDAIAHHFSAALKTVRSNCVYRSAGTRTNVVAAGLAARQVVRDSHGSVQASVQDGEKEKRPQIVDLRAFL
ncbi:hypothetical protein [Xanthomonas sacchari]|uniref:hypothetical protein n=1 Tax=Xanthomonas sacchari TaxID=56458 RepID=UPI00225DE2A0|nr:hypothetical protein [Xanthomonas sacchari]